MVKRYKLSPIWNYFRDDNNANKRAECTLCGRDISFKGGSTFNLTRHLRIVHPGVLKGPVQRKYIETQQEEPKDVQVKIETVESLNRDVILSELEVLNDSTNEITADADITWAQPEAIEPEPKEPDFKKLRQNPLEHFKPTSSNLVPIPIREINRSSRERSPGERRNSEMLPKQTNSTDTHFQNSGEDPIDIFGKSVVAQLKMLPKRQAITTQLKIQSILTEQLLEYEDSRL